MIASLKLPQVSAPAGESDYGRGFSGSPVTRRSHDLRHRRPYHWRLASLSTKSSNSPSFEPSVSSSTFTSAVGPPTSALPPLSQWSLTQRHILVLNFIACAVAVSATWLFCSAIPTLLAFKRAAESLEKLLDVTREELPDTMAAVRLSGMEISDLTMELSDLGQGITQGVKSSTRAVRLAEERLRRLTNMAQSVPTQVAVVAPTGPVVARTARGIREGIVKSRGFVQMFFTVARFSKMALNYLTARAESKSKSKA